MPLSCSSSRTIVLLRGENTGDDDKGNGHGGNGSESVEWGDMSDDARQDSGNQER